MTKKEMRETLRIISDALDEMPSDTRDDVEDIIQELQTILDEGWVYEIR